MLDSVFTALHRSVILLDLVDDAWATDCLSDDGAAPRLVCTSALLTNAHFSISLCRRFATCPAREAVCMLAQFNI